MIVTIGGNRVSVEVQSSGVARAQTAQRAAAASETAAAASATAASTSATNAAASATAAAASAADAVTTLSTAALKANNLSDLASASTARTNLGLGTMATQAAGAVAITGGSVTGITDITVADGGTGASTAAAARTNLGLVIGTDVQAYDADLTTWAGVTPAAGVTTFISTPSSANLAAAVTDETGTGALVFANSPTLVAPALGTPASGVLTNATGLPISSGVSGLGTGVATFLGTPSSANLAAALTDETGSGAAVFATSPTLVTPNLGTPSALTLTNATGLPVAGGGTGASTAADARTNLAVVGTTDLAASTGAALVGSITTGTGATARTVQAKLRDVISVKDFGATGDGTTDDTSAIQAALTALTAYSTLHFPAGTYKVSSQLTLAVSNVTLEGRAKIICAATSNYEYIFRATSLTGVTIRDLEFDLNQSARAAIQTARFHGPYVNSCTDFIFDGVTVRNTLGYGGVSAVGIAIGQGTRCEVRNCRVIDCGSGAATSDGIYTSGTQTLISNCTAYNCTDTAFVLENSDYSGITGCTSVACGAGGAITLSTSDNRRGNYIDGLTVINWDAPSTGGVQIGTLSSTGNLYDTSIDGLTMYANTASGYGSGAALWVRRVGTGNTIGLKVTGLNVTGADYAVRVNDAESVSITGAILRSIASSALLLLAGGTHVLSAITIKTAATGIDVQGTGTVVYAKGCVIDGTTSSAVTALNTSVLNISGLDIIGITSGVRTTKDAGATLNFGGAVNNIVTNTATTLTVGYTHSTIIQTTAASVYTLPAASSALGMTLNILTHFAGTVTSASSNVVPLAGGAAGTAILDATAGKWARLQSDGTNWKIIAAN